MAIMSSSADMDADAALGVPAAYPDLVGVDAEAAANVLVAAEQRRAWDKSKFDAGAVADERLERAGIAGEHQLGGQIEPPDRQRTLQLVDGLGGHAGLDIGRQDIQRLGRCPPASCAPAETA